jgi:pimeloyl-ACP methyl ester carboxylesterase
MERKSTVPSARSECEYDRRAVYSDGLERNDFRIESERGIEVFVRWVRDESRADHRVPVLLLHGARAPSIPSFDLPVPGGSLASDLARAGHDVFLLDARGYGGSTRPPEMSVDPRQSPPLVRTAQVVRDIAATVDVARSRANADRVALLGWATGSQWLAHYAATHPYRVSHLALYNALHPVAGPWPLGDGMEDPERPGELRPGTLGGYAYATGDALLARWDQSIPIEDKDAWRDPAVADAYIESALASDPTSFERAPPSFRVPLGALADSFYLTRGHRLWDSTRVTARVLILTAERDFWSRSVDRKAMTRDLRGAANIERVLIPDATHYVHLDRPDRGRDNFLESVLRFLES